MSKMSRFNAARKFEITSRDVEKIADYAIQYQSVRGRVPIFSITCKMVMTEIASKYTIISRMNREVLNGLAKFVSNEIMKKYIWRKDNIAVAQKFN